MTVMSTAVGGSMLAHGLHEVMVLLGLWGLAALLLPHALTHALRPTPPSVPADDHERRVADLRAAMASGSVGVVAPPVRARTARVRSQVPALSVPLAVVASSAAAGIHAAVAPAHLREQAVVGVFLLAAASAQAVWAVATLRPTSRLLRTGILLHLALVAVWLLSRTAALPFGLQAEPHPVGPWDLTCVAWEVVAVVACARTLRDTRRDDLPVRCPGWFDWHPSTRSAVGLAVIALVLLTLSGAHA